MEKSERVVKFIETLRESGMSQNEIAKVAKMGQPNISGILNGKRKADSGIIYKLVLFLNGNLEWFETGEGNMFRSSINESDSELKEKCLAMQAENKKLLELIAKLSNKNLDQSDEIEELKNELQEVRKGNEPPQRRAGAESA